MVKPFMFTKNEKQTQRKIDQSFVHNCTENTRQVAIVKSIISLAHILNLNLPSTYADFCR